MARKKKEKRVRKLLYLIGASVVVVISLIQILSLMNGIFGKIPDEKEMEKDLLSSSPKNLIKPCNNEKPAEEKVKFIPKRIIIDKVGIDLPVVSVPLKGGTWQVNTGVANYAEGTNLVSIESGNVGLFAHDRKKGFADIKNLKVGDTISIYGTLHKATYSVEYSSVTVPDKVDVFYSTAEPTLTLVTCDGSFSQKRFIVRAKLVEISETNCNEQNIE